MSKPTKTEQDFDSIPDEIYLSPEHEGLLPELKPIRTNTFSNKKADSIKDRLMLLAAVIAVGDNFGSAFGPRPRKNSSHAEKEALKAKMIKENKEAQERDIWNKKIEDERRDKQTRKKLKKIKAIGRSSADSYYQITEDNK